MLSGVTAAALMLPVAQGASVRAGTGFAAGQAPAPVCDADAQPANLDFTLQDMYGGDVNLASFRGQVIVLNFWATWCGPCRIEIPGLVELQATYGDQGLVVLGLSVNDTVSQIRPFAEAFEVNYPMLVGLDRMDFQRAFAPISGIPITFVIARDGTWCRTHRGLTSKAEVERDIRALL